MVIREERGPREKGGRRTILQLRLAAFAPDDVFALRVDEEIACWSHAVHDVSHTCLTAQRAREAVWSHVPFLVQMLQLQMRMSPLPSGARGCDSVTV